MRKHTNASIRHQQYEEGEYVNYVSFAKQNYKKIIGEDNALRSG